MRSGELIERGFVNDLFSAFYPFALASPHIRGLELERWGLGRRTSRVAVAHPARDGSCPAVALDIDETTRSLEEFAEGEGQAWRERYRLWERVRDGALAAFFDPFPPIRGMARLLRALGPEELVRFARFFLLPVRRMGEETFRGDGGPRLLAGNALHADVGPGGPLSGVFGWVLCSLAQQHGFPVPEGGAGQLTAALVRRVRDRGGEVVCGQAVDAIERVNGRAVGVRTADRRYAASRAVLADVVAPDLYRDLLGGERLPPRSLADLERFQLDYATVKLDGTLDGPIPWSAARARGAGTVHVAEGIDALTKSSAELARGLIPEDPSRVMGQYSHFDPTRAPEGKETAWAYTPRSTADPRRRGASCRARGTTRRPTGSRHGSKSRSRLSLLHGLYLASASAHPAGGVHGGPGANAARAALSRQPRGASRPMAWMSRAFSGSDWRLVLSTRDPLAGGGVAQVVPLSAPAVGLV